jgi:hypothetical protein
VEKPVYFLFLTLLRDVVSQTLHKGKKGGPSVAIQAASRFACDLLLTGTSGLLLSIGLDGGLQDMLPP